MTEIEAIYNRSSREYVLRSHGESAVVTFPDGTTRNIKAIVRRRNLDSSDHRPATPKMSVQVANDATLGISSSEIDVGGSLKMSIAYRMGQAVQAFGVYFRPEHEGVSHDGCFLYLELR